jgi:hypothetical protein
MTFILCTKPHLRQHASCDCVVREPLDQVAPMTLHNDLAFGRVGPARHHDDA